MLGLLERQQLALDSMSALLASVLDISKLDSGGVRRIRRPARSTRSSSGCDPTSSRRRRTKVSSSSSSDRQKACTRIPSSCAACSAISCRTRSVIRSAGKSGSPAPAAAKCVAIDVRDTGIGIPPDQLERVFEEFYQVDHGTQRPEGLGLGLSIVRRLQQLLGCGVQVESVVGKGTRFTSRCRAPRSPHASRRNPPARGAAAGGRVLVVDDERPVAEATGLLLEIEGFEVSIASSEREALDCMRSILAGRHRERLPPARRRNRHRRGRGRSRPSSAGRFR